MQQILIHLFLVLMKASFSPLFTFAQKEPMLRRDKGTFKKQNHATCDTINQVSIQVQNDIANVRDLSQEMASDENSASFLVIADLHTMSTFAFQDQNLSPASQYSWNNLTSIMDNIRYNYVKDSDALVLAPGDLVSFGQLSNDKIKRKSGFEDENDAVYSASIKSYAQTRKLLIASGFSTFLPSIGDHEIGGELTKFIKHAKLFFLIN